jgi:hypothetical protein
MIVSLKTRSVKAPGSLKDTSKAARAASRNFVGQNLAEVIRMKNAIEVLLEKHC